MIVITRVEVIDGESSVFLYARALIRVSIAASDIPPASAVQVTVEVEPDTATTAAPELVAVSATHVAIDPNAQSEPSITRYSVVSATFVIVITNERNVCVGTSS